MSSLFCSSAVVDVLSLHAKVERVLPGLVTVTGLECEWTANPLGIECERPRLSWRLESEREGARQVAWQVLVATSKELLKPSVADLWDSGKVNCGSAMPFTNVVYAGARLSSCQCCHWTVRVWDENGLLTEFAAPQRWEMGLLTPKDWAAEWIGYPAGRSGKVLFFQHEFELRMPPVSARAYVAGIGYHELRLNGEKVGHSVLEPGWTEYSKRILYITHDLGECLMEGKNTVEVIVGPGWLGMPMLKIQIEAVYADGTKDVIYSRGGHSDAPKLWQVSDGPIVKSSIYDGEIYDARIEIDKWDTAVPVCPPTGRLVSQVNEAIEIVETLNPSGVGEPRPGVFVFDVGRNLAGWVLLRVQVARGTMLTLRFAENLNSDGTVDRGTLRSAAATDVYIAAGTGVEEWEPRFTYHGFRYVQLEGLPGVPDSDTLQVRVVRSAVERRGHFRCSHELLNRIQEVVVNTEASNLHSVPTDCPQRNERMGWLNDMTVRAEQALYNFRLDRFYEKWLEDVADTQEEDGSITDTAPFKWGKRPADPVSVSYLLTAWLLSQHSGDHRVLERHYEGFVRWTRFLLGQAENFILNVSSWGDWAPPKEFSIPGSDGAGAIASGTPGGLVSTAFLYYHAKLVARIAEVLGKKMEAEEWCSVAGEVGVAFNHRFWNGEKKGYGSNNQACNALALALALVPAKRIAQTVGNLVADVEARDFHLTTGNLCTKYLLETLTEHGHVDVAFRIATQTTYPSWGFMLANGATTLWERWELLTDGGMNSHNHPMHGSISCWFFKYLAGIRFQHGPDVVEPILIHPFFPTGLDWVQASCPCSYGEVFSAWKRENGKIRMKIRIPENAKALIHVPSARPRNMESVGPGTHFFVISETEIAKP